MIEETANKAKHGEMEEDRSPGTGALMNLQIYTLKKVLARAHVPYNT